MSNCRIDRGCTVTADPHIGLIGCGRWGRHILRDLLALGCRVSVVSVSDESRRYAREHGALSAVGDLEALTDQVDGIIIAVKTSLHYEILKQTLPRNVPVFCEKPLTDNADGAWEIADLAADRVFVMDKWRYHPAIELLAERVAAAEFGRVISIDSHRLQWGSSHSDVDVVWTVMPHELSIIRHVLGRIPPLRSALGEWRNGELCGISALLSDSVGATTRVSDNYPVHLREVRVVCEGAVLLLDDPYADHVNLYRLDGERLPSKLPLAEKLGVSTEFPLLRELRWFCDYLKGGPAPLSNANEAAAVVAMIADMRAAAERLRNSGSNEC
nr:Gfo/Idh/MocA family oxidoreductase [Pseudomarimonas arenosa]